MKTRELESLEKRWVAWGTLKWLVLSAALLWVLWSPTEAWAKTVSSDDDGVKVTEVTKPWTAVMQPWMEVTQQNDTIFLEDTIKMIEKDGPWIEPDLDDDGKDSRTLPKDKDGWEKKWDDGEKKPWVTGWDWDYDVPDIELGQGWEKKWSRIWVHGFVQVWTSVVPDFAGIFSDKVSWMIGIDAKDPKTWLWLTVIRLDDFYTDPEYPLSRASVVVPYRTITSKDGKRSLWTSVEFSFVDQMPGDVGVMPVVVWTYSDGWRTIEWKYFHDIRKWEDMDAFRLWITKKIWDILSLTVQWWYKSDYAEKFYGRVIADVNLWGGFWAQLSCIAKDWKLTPTAWVMYKF